MRRRVALVFLAVAAARHAPQIPTIAESLPGYEFTTWHVLAAPVKTPAPILATLSEKVRTALKTPDGLRRWQQERGLEVIASTPRR